MTTVLAAAPSRPPYPGQVMLTDAARAALRHKAAFLRSVVLPELLAELADQSRDRRLDAQYHRVRRQIAALDDLTSTAGSTRTRCGQASRKPRLSNPAPSNTTC